MSYLEIYHSMPIVMRTFIASAYGYYLRAQRYGIETEALVQENRIHETWSLDQWKRWQEEKLAYVLHQTAMKVPYYREYWGKRRRYGDFASWDYLENWPVLSKDAVRNQPQAFIANNVNLYSQIVEHTSGTTGKPMTFWMDKDAVRHWFALFETRWRGWYGFTRYDRWGILGGQLVVPYKQAKPPFWVWNAGMQQLYLSSYHISAQNVSAYLRAIQQHRLIYLLGYASSLYSLAQLVLEQNLKIPYLQAIISNAEPLYVHQRELISHAFRCPVYDTYGLSENVCAASECLHGNLHLWPEVGVTEILDDDSDEVLPMGQTGRLICTGLLNKTMPLIRYEIGDRAFFSPDTFCTCGRTLPILGGIEGRKDDVLITPDGRRIGRLDPVFKADLPLREAQIIQENLNCLRVLYVPAQDYSTVHQELLLKRLRERVGDMQISFQEVAQIPRSSNGKFRAVISKVK